MSAIDRRRFLREVYGEMAKLSIGPIPPGVLGYDAGERDTSTTPNERARCCRTPDTTRGSRQKSGGPSR